RPLSLSCVPSRVFLSSSRRAPPSLHPFPTRRSSDLGGFHPDQSRRPADLLQQGGLAPLLQRFLQRRVRLEVLRYALLARRGHHQDRKSTRLNSSHVKISYAVFCLKKKTKKHTSTHNT